MYVLRVLAHATLNHELLKIGLSLKGQKKQRVFQEFSQRAWIGQENETLENINSLLFSFHDRQIHLAAAYLKPTSMV